MSNNTQMRQGLWAPPTRNVSLGGSRPAKYAGVNLNRQTRHEARSERRWGNWGILGIPTAVLWFDELELAALEDEIEVWEPAIIDIWS